MKQARGIIPAMLSVFHDDGSVNLDGTRAYAEWLIRKGVHGLSPCGSTGEGAAMTDDERLQVIQATVAQADGRVPVYAGIIHYSTRLAVRLAVGSEPERLRGVEQVVAPVVAELDALLELELVALVVGAVAGALPAADQPAERGQLGVQALGDLDVDVHFSSSPLSWRRRPNRTNPRISSANALVTPAAMISTHTRTASIGDKYMDPARFRLRPSARCRS